VVLVLGQQDDRHTVVDRRHERVRLGGDDGTRRQLAVSVGVTPVLIEASEAEKVAVFARDAVLRLRARVTLPLEEGAGRNEAAPE
jgi:hypothetical protein